MSYRNRICNLPWKTDSFGSKLHCQNPFVYLKQVDLLLLTRIGAFTFYFDETGWGSEGSPSSAVPASIAVWGSCPTGWESRWGRSVIPSSQNASKIASTVGWVSVPGWSGTLLASSGWSGSVIIFSGCTGTLVSSLDLHPLTDNWV